MNKITVFCKEDANVKVGDEVVLTTSEFNFNSLTGTFDVEAIKSTVVLAEKIGKIIASL